MVDTFKQAFLIDVAVGGLPLRGAVDAVTLKIYAAVLRVRKAVEGEASRRGCRVVVVGVGSKSGPNVFDSQSFAKAAEAAFRSKSRAVAYSVEGSTTFVEWCEHPPMEELRSSDAIKVELESLRSLTLPPLQKPLHFLRLEHLLAAVQTAQGLTHEDRIQIRDAVNGLLVKFNAAIRASDGTIANHIKVRLRGNSSGFQLVPTRGGPKGFAKLELEVIHALANRRDT